MASVTGIPSPSTIRPSTVTLSPLTPGTAMLSVNSQVRPMCKYGPIVWDEVVCRLMIEPLSRQIHIVLERRLIAPAQDDVELVAERRLGNRRLPVEGGYQPLPCALARNAV